MEDIIHTAKEISILRVVTQLAKVEIPTFDELFGECCTRRKSSMYILWVTRNLIDADDIKNITLELIDQGRLNQIINEAYLENFQLRNFRNFRKTFQ